MDSVASRREPSAPVLHPPFPTCRPAGRGGMEERGQGPGAAGGPRDALLPGARPQGTQPVLPGRVAPGAGTRVRAGRRGSGLGSGAAERVMGVASRAWDSGPVGGVRHSRAPRMCVPPMHFPRPERASRNYPGLRCSVAHGPSGEAHKCVMVKYGGSHGGQSCCALSPLRGSMSQPRSVASPPPGWRAVGVDPHSSMLVPQPPNPATCEVVHVSVFRWLTWTLCVEPPGGWGPKWCVGTGNGVLGLR